MASKFNDVPAYTVAAGREVYERVECDFLSTSGGSYYSRRCHNLAKWREAYLSSDGTLKWGTYGNLRCERHRSIDERTRRNSRWGSNDPRPYVAFDGVAEAQRIVAEAAAAAEVERLEKVHEQVKVSIAYVLKHAVLATDERMSLQQVMNDLNGGTLEVR